MYLLRRQQHTAYKNFPQLLGGNIGQTSPGFRIQHILSPHRRKGFCSHSLRRQATMSKPCDVSAPSELYPYTSGRFLFNERLRLQERYVAFDIKELYAAVHRVLGSSHGDVIHMSKLAEGGFNRVFLLRMQDGFELIAKIPYRLAGPAFYATASEAATMTFLRSKGIPLPEVYDYCARADNPVQSEYILMEKAPGVSATSKWTDLSTKDIIRLAQSVVELETKLFALSFAATGSLYFKRDLPEHEQTALYANDDTDSDTKTFCIGPIADYMFWIGRRASLELDRGPWLNPVTYLQAIARKEITWTKKFGKPREPEFPYNALDFGCIKQPSQYISALTDYLALTPHLLPRDPSHEWNRPTIRHPDLTPANIQIDPETSRVVSLIDWQHTIIQPRILAAGYAPAFENPETTVSGKLVEPQLPENFNELQGEEQAVARDFHHRQLLFYYYRVFTGGLNHGHHRAVTDPMLPLRHLLVDYAGRQWCGNVYTLKGAIIRTARWPWRDHEEED